MSRIGRKPITVPSGVDVSIDGDVVVVKGPKGQLALTVPATIGVARDGDDIVVTRPDDVRQNRALHGLTRSLVANMVTGVAEGYVKELEIVGVGYRAQAAGPNKLDLQLGYSHPIEFLLPASVDCRIDKLTHIVLSSHDKEMLGQVASNMRSLRPPDPYKNKGVRYTGEALRKKVGKAGAGGKGGK